MSPAKVFDFSSCSPILRNKSISGIAMVVTYFYNVIFDHTLLGVATRNQVKSGPTLFDNINGAGTALIATEPTLSENGRAIMAPDPN